VVGTGGAVRPVTLCLSAQGPRWTDPTIAPAFDGLKISVSRRVTFIDRSLLRSSFLGPRNERFNRRLSPPGFRSAPQSGSYGALVAPSTEMSCITIYLVDHLERDGRAFHLVPSTDHLGGSADAHGARLTARRPLRAASVRSTSNSDRTGVHRNELTRCAIRVSTRRSKKHRYSITSSARASSAEGISRPSALAALRLMASWIFVGCCTGRSVGFSPLRIRST